ncbi:hypothetical protein QE152_g34082 [Popillia japonica]|uniref:Reverse transcriptase domain-containing protein n=1 Tax=Popillia japonica TaxID=7064 RepID=A0AAW1IUN7_POPJA
MNVESSPDFDGLLSEFPMQTSNYVRKWVTSFFPDILGKVYKNQTKPQIRQISKWVTSFFPDILGKVYKNQTKPQIRQITIEPVGFLDTLYEMLEGLLYHRISSHILETVPLEHAGFRPNRGVGSTNPRHRHSDSDYLN